MKQELLNILENRLQGNKQKFIVFIFNSKEASILKNRIIEETSFLKNPTISQRIWHILNNSQKVNLCECGNITKFFDLSKGYNQFCSRKCQYKSVNMRNKIEQTNLKRYGDR